MRRQRREAGGRRALPVLRGPSGERGMILVLTLVILLVLSMLAGASLINGLLERSQARAEAQAAVALYAAEAGVGAGMAWLSDPANIDNYPTEPGDLPDPTVIVNAYTTNTGWQDWTRVISGSFANGGSYTATVRFKRERRDRNGDGDCCDKYPDVPVDEDSEFKDGDANLCTDCPGDVVLFNAGTGDGRFGFSGSYFSGSAGDEGFPVVEIESVGARGATSVREVALTVARNHKAQVEGAFTSRATVTAAGSSVIDGRNYDSPLFPGSCGSDLPGVTVDVGATAPPCGSNIVSSGSTPCSANFDPTASGKRDLEKTPWAALGMTEVDFKSMFTKDTTSTRITTPGVVCNPANPPKANLWYANENGIKLNNSSTCSDYQGILVVHNEGFDPDTWATNCPDAASMSSAFCSNPANQPATFEMSGNVTWNGIVVADHVMMVTGTPTIVGAVISLASGGYIRSQIGGNITIKYSCDAVAAVTKSIGYKRKIGWQRLR